MLTMLPSALLSCNKDAVLTAKSLFQQALLVFFRKEVENNTLLYSNSHTMSILSINRSNGGISSPRECQPKQVHPLLISAEPTGGTASKGFFPLAVPFLFITVLNGQFPNSPNFTIKNPLQLSKLWLFCKCSKEHCMTPFFHYS